VEVEVAVAQLLFCDSIVAGAEDAGALAQEVPVSVRGSAPAPVVEF
jgi:hypothetical protein